MGFRTLILGAILLIPAARPPLGAGVLVDPGWLQEHLEDGRVVVLHVDFGLEAADAAGRLEYLDGHVPGARLVPWNHLVAKRGLLPVEMPPVEDLLSLVRRLGILPEHRIVLYDTGTGLEAARAFVALDYLGLGAQLSLLDGQWKRWWREGRPVSRLPAEVESSYLPVRLRPEVMVDRNAVRDLSWLAAEPESRGALLDARPEDEYWGDRPGKGVARAGHIPGAANLPWAQLLVSEANPSFKEEGELRRRFEAAGAEPGRVLVVYCRTGTQASLLYVAARLLGYEQVMLYDGSFLDWSSVPELPVVNKWM